MFVTFAIVLYKKAIRNPVAKMFFHIVFSEVANLFNNTDYAAVLVNKI